MSVDVVSALVGWVVSLIGDAGIRLVRRSRDKRALSKAMRLAVDQVVEQADSSSREALRLGLRECFSAPPRLGLDGSTSVSEGLRAAIAAQVAQLEGLVHSGTGRSFYQVVAVDGGWLVEQVTSAILTALRQVAAAGGLTELVHGVDTAEVLARLDMLVHGSELMVSVSVPRGRPAAAVPAARLAGFVERPAIGERLVEALMISGPGEPVILTGPGGFGKTILAAWACQRVLDHFPDGVLWVELGQRPDDVSLINIITDLIHGLTDTKPFRYETVRAAAEALAAAIDDQRILLVIDDVWRKEDLEWFLGGGPRCVRLVTTRRSPVVLGHEIPVGSMTADEATALLSRGLPNFSAESLAPLLDRCDRWPLALSLLRGTLHSRVRRCRVPVAEAVSDLLAGLDRSGVEMLDDFAYTDGRRGVAATLGISLEELATTSPYGKKSLDRYISLAAFPDGTSIAYRHLERLWQLDTVRAQSECDRFLNHSLAVNADENGIQLHGAVRDWLRRRFSDQMPLNSRRLLDAYLQEAHGWHALTDDLRRDLIDQLAYHLVQAESVKELGELLRDFRYLVSRLYREGPAALESDLNAYSSTAAGEEDEYTRRLLTLLRQNAHLLFRQGIRETDLVFTMYSRLFGRLRVEHVDEALPERGLVPEQPLPDQVDSRLARSLTGHRGQVSSIVWQTNGLLMTVGGDDGTLRRWNLMTGNQETEQQICDDWVLKAWLSPNCRYLAAVAMGRWYGKGLSSEDRGEQSSRQAFLPPLMSVLIVDTATGTTVGKVDLSTIELIENFIGNRYKLSMAWAPDSTTLAVAAGHEIWLWSPFDQSQSRTLHVDHGLWAIGWHPVSGLACVTAYGAVMRWPDPMTTDHRNCIDFLYADEHVPSALAWNPDGTRIVITTYNGFSMGLIVVEIDPSGELRNAWSGQAEGIGCPCAISWRPDGNAFTIASNDDFAHDSLVSLWDASSPQKTYSVVDSRYVGVLDLAWQPSGEHLAVAYVDSTVRLWQPTSEQATRAAYPCATMIHRHTHPAAQAVKAVKDGAHDQPVIWILPPGVPLTTYDAVAEEDSAEMVIARSADGAFLTVVEWDERIRWVWRSTQACQDFHIAPRVAVHMFGFPDIHLSLRRISDGHTVRRVSWRMPRGLAVDPTKSYMAAANESGAIALFDMRTLDRICQIYIDEPAQACAFDYTGERLAVVGSVALYLFQLRG